MRGNEYYEQHEKNLAVSAILMGAILVVGGTFVTTTTQAAFAVDKNGGGGQQENSKNGNTGTALKCQNKGYSSGFDTAVNQECENTICTHPGAGATCVSESSGAAAGGGVGELPIVCRGEPGVVGLRAIARGDGEVCVDLPSPIAFPPCSAPLVYSIHVFILALSQDLNRI